MSRDTNEVKNIPWVKEMLLTLQTSVSNSVESFAQIAMQLSDNRKDIDSWVNIFQEQFQETIDDLLNDMQQLQNNTLNKVENSLKRIQELCKLLQIEMPTFGTEKLCLFQEQQQLKKYIHEYEEIVDARKTQLNKLMTEQEKLCKSLGKRIKAFGEDSLPTQTELKHLQEIVDELESEHFQRLEKYAEHRDDILQKVNKLKYKPVGEFERIICEDNDKKEFYVSDENMDKLEKFRNKLNSEVQRVTEEIENLWNSINQHWNMLDIDLVEREEFRKKYPRVSYEVLDGLRQELRRCQDLKKANIKVFVERLRMELIEQWQKCRCSENVKKEFGFFHTTCYTEDLLELHENELKKWKTYYEENKELIHLLEKHQKLWSKLIELEENASGPNRYNNRGGQLLREEKERNKLSKNIPTIEDDLRLLAQKYESRNGSAFLVCEQTVEEYINNLHAERENARKLKLSARKQNRDNTVAVPAKSCVTLTPLASGSKRKLALTPLMESQKKAKLTSKLFATEPKQRTANIPKVVVSRISSERKKRVESVKRRSLMKRKKQAHDETNSSEYSAFQNELTYRIGCRSTMNSLAEEIASTKNTVKTPSKPKVGTTPCKKLTPKTDRRTPNKPLTPNGTRRQISTLKSPLKLIF